MDGKSRKLGLPRVWWIHRQLPQDPELHCGPISMTQKNGNSLVLTAKVFVGMKHIAWNLSLVAQSSSVERRAVPGLVRRLWWDMGYPAVKEPDTCGICGTTKWVSRNVLPRERSAPFGDVEKEVLLEAASGPREPSEPGLFSSGYGKTGEHAMISSFLVSAVGETSGPAVISSLSAEVTALPPSPLRNVTSTPELSGESYGTVTRTTKRMSSTHFVPVVPSGVELVSRARANPRRSRKSSTGSETQTCGAT